MTNETDQDLLNDDLENLGDTSLNLNEDKKEWQEEEKQEEGNEKEENDAQKEKKENLSEADILKIKSWLGKIKSATNNILNLLEEKESGLPIIFDKRGGGLFEPPEKESGHVIEGVFDGQNMIGPDGKQYSIPANYASKSKLVEGDILKLTITPRGSFIYKQIGPVERERLIGKLRVEESTGEFYALTDGQKYKLLNASVTYFKGCEGDDIVILVPKDKSSAWAAVENVIKI